MRPKPTRALTGVARRHLAENLRIIRLIRHWSQEELAEAAGLDRSYIGGIERAERNVGLDTLEKIANATGVSLAELVHEPSPHRLAEILEAVRRSVDGAPWWIREAPGIYLVCTGASQC